MRHSLLMLLFACSRSPASLASHFNELAASKESQPDRIIATLALEPGSVVADLGAGGGYYTLKLAKAVGPTGRVHAVDVERGLLDLLASTLTEQGIANVSLVLGTGERSNLPERAIGLVFVRNTFHDISHQASYFAGLRQALAPGGRVAVIDYKPEGFWRRLHGHAMAAEKIAGLMSEAGYERITSYAFLSEQSFQIFAPVTPAP